MSRKTKYAQRARIAVERLEIRNLLAADWMLQNPVEPDDVDDDGSISPLDALHVINQLNTPDGEPTGQRFLDVNGDGHCTPVDALGVINRLNLGNAPASPPTDDASSDAIESEGEASRAAAPRPVPLAPLPRSIDGSGNNVAHPDWGSTDSDFIRVGPAEYGDGISTPAGADRPNPRTISNSVGDEDEEHLNDRHMTAMIYAWGQFLDHDLDLTGSAEPTEAFNIPIPTGDPEFDPAGTGTKVMPLSRSQFDSATGTSTDNPRQQFNSLTSFVDASQVYGSDDARAAALRTMSGGKLKTSDGNLLPYNVDGLPNIAFDPDPTTAFVAGDIRANENIELASLHVLWMREHNRLADEIAAREPTLSDEQIYQRARAVVIGEMQAITYNEFVPTLLGMDALRPYTGYKPNVNPGIANEFASAAFRVGHTLLGEDVEFLDNDGNEIREPVALRDAFFNTTVLGETGIDPILNYLATANAREVDTMIVEDVRNFLFGPPGAGGLDLASLNIQRGRDHGLADFNATREAYGLPRVRSFSDITSDAELAGRLEELYGSVDNIDLWVGGLAEDHVPGSSVGPTFRRIIADQFERTRDGDRYWFQNTFRGRQLEEIGRTTLSDVIRRNTTSAVTGNVFFDSTVMQHNTNPRSGGDIVVTSSAQNVAITDRRTRRVIDEMPVADVEQVVIVGANDQPDRIMIDAARFPLPNIETDGGAGLRDMLVVRAAPGTTAITVGRRTISMDDQTIDFSRFETVSIEAARTTHVTVSDNVGVEVLVNGRRVRAGQPSTTPAPTGPTNPLPTNPGNGTQTPAPGGAIGGTQSGRPDGSSTRPSGGAANTAPRAATGGNVVNTLAEDQVRRRQASGANADLGVTSTDAVFGELGSQTAPSNPQRRR